METNNYDYNARDSRNIAKMKYNSGLPVKISVHTQSAVEEKDPDRSNID